MKKRNFFQGFLVLGMWLIIIPAFILFLSNDINIGLSFDFPFNIGVIILGCTLICLGSWLLLVTNFLFIRIGRGTASPFAPPKNFVVTGFYQYVRNPMTIGIILTILGESVVLGSFSLFIWFLVFSMTDHILLILWEEPILTRRFGNEYILYKKNVPRWIPRLKPYEKSKKDLER
ncbi:MAG: methyltransferase family protein [Candidatus Hodarchaeales archaeon]|jgi:protein-S-isoprenylcysteine O-methyltransferase Ste14